MTTALKDHYLDYLAALNERRFDDLVACRLYFDCTPAKRFLGFEPSGDRIRFSEHVFYRFAADRIVAVTSLLDVTAIGRQLSPAG